MQRLKDGLILYHGSFTEVRNIELLKCLQGLDFGRGFYVTSSYEQACSYIPTAVKKARIRDKGPSELKIEDGRINVYRFHASPELLVHYFDEFNEEYLHFVAGCKDDALFPKL